MKVCVFGLWHLGSVTAAALASKGVKVVGLDYDSKVIEKLKLADAPIFEPGLNDLINKQISAGNLSFSNAANSTIESADVIWIAFDTPVDDDDNADVQYVLDQTRSILPFVKDGAVILSSSQLPVGSISNLMAEAKKLYPNKKLGFAVSPENLRLGKAIDVFLNPDRIIVGTSDQETRKKLTPLFSSITDKIEWMSIPSAEMVKHAINSFLATSITFINEVATLCETVGADAKEVERGLKTEARIGPKAYLSPGGPFAGGTLARDIQFLNALADQKSRSIPLLNSIRSSNIEHKKWELNTLKRAVADLKGKKIAVLGLTYKADTNTLRRSRALEICDSLLENGCQVNAWDARVTELPDEYTKSITLFKTVSEALNQCDAAIICTDWPELRELHAEVLSKTMKTAVVLDIARIAANNLSHKVGLRYFTLGNCTCPTN